MSEVYIVYGFWAYCFTLYVIYKIAIHYKKQKNE